MKRFLLTSLNNIKPVRFYGRDRNKEELFCSHKCSTKGCRNWARFVWDEETKDLVSRKRKSERKYGCYYHTPKIFSLGLP